MSLLPLTELRCTGRISELLVSLTTALTSVLFKLLAVRLDLEIGTTFLMVSCSESFSIRTGLDGGVLLLRVLVDLEELVGLSFKEFLRLVPGNSLFFEVLSLGIRFFFVSSEDLTFVGTGCAGFADTEFSLDEYVLSLHLELSESIAGLSALVSSVTILTSILSEQSNVKEQSVASCK